eukprot:jgi/Undpi1/6903/HiC_scaffold_21.g09378.m1
MVMSLIDALKRGQPLPELSTASTLKKSVKRSDLRPSVTSRVVESSRETEVVSPPSPKRQSRVASLVGNEQHRQATPGTNTSEGERDTALQHEGQERVKSTGSHKLDDTGKRKVDALGLGGKPSRYDELGDGSEETAGNRKNHWEQWRKHPPKLRQLNANDVDAVFAESQRAISSLRDVQSWRVLVMGLHRLAEKDNARRVPVTLRARRRHSLPIAVQGQLALKQEFLPGKGRRTSLLATAYEPAALFLTKRAKHKSTREAELEKATAIAASKWHLKPVTESHATGGVQVDTTTGNLNVSGLPLLNEDVDVIVHLLRQNFGFKKLDLSRCFLSDKHFVGLAQALAWNCRVQEICLKECVFTDVGTEALADVLTVNKHISSIDIRGCQGVREQGLREILKAAGVNSNLAMINGIDVAALRAENSDVLDLNGWGLGFVEAAVVADCLSTRPDGLQSVDLHNNSLTTEAFATLMVALRKQSQLRSLDLSNNMVDERSLPEITEILQRNPRLANVNLRGNRISCSEFEHFGLNLMRVLSSNNTVTVFDVGDNDVSQKMLAIVAEKLAVNRAIRRDLTFVDCLHLKYPRVAPRPVLADPRSLHLEDADVHFMIQEGISQVTTTNPCEAAAEGRQVGEDINTKCTGDIKVGDLLKKAGDHLLDIHPAFHSHGATRAFDIENPCEAAAEGQVGEDINTKCTGDIKVGDLLKKAGDHLLDIHPAFHSHGATRAFDIEIHKTIDKKQECKVLGTSAEEEESKQACMLLRKQC